MLKGRLWLPLRRVRLLGPLTLAALLLMGAFAGVAHAANPVSGLTVDPLTPSDAGGARTDYVIHFSTSATGLLTPGQHITITLPMSSNTTTIVNTVVTDTTTSTQVGTCGVSSQTIEVCTISSGKSVADGDHLTVELDGVTNPPQNLTGGQQTLSVVTDADTATATANYSVVAASSITTPTVNNSSPSTAAGARTDYVITFSTSSTGGMSGTAHSQITITFPGTATTPFNTTTIVNAIVTDTTTSTQVGTCGVSSQTVEVCTISSGKSVTAGDTLKVELDGVTTESPAPVKMADLLTVSTTSDVNTTTSNPYPVVTAGTITTPTVNNSSPSTAAGARTDYVITFTTSGTGGMSATAHSQITITFPGTATTPFNTSTIVNAIVTDTTTSTQVGTCGVSSQTVEVCTISSGKSVTAGDTLKVELDGVTTESPAPAKLADLLTVSTTSDVNTTTSNPYPVANIGAISTPTVVNSSPSTAAGARTDYVITFNTSSTGGMSGTAHSQITITFPATATTPFNTTTIVNAIVTDTTTSTQVGTCGVSSQTVEVCTITAGKTVTAGDTLTVELDGVTTESPAPTGNTDTLSVSTTSDTTTKTSSTYPVTNGRAITAPRVDNTSPSTAAGARTDYVMTFTTSSTGGMSGTAHSQITITFPATATTPFNTTTIVNAIVTDATTSTQVGTCGVSSQTVEVCTIAAGKTVTAGDVLKIELDGVTTESPAPNGNLHTLTVSTTSDTTTMTSVTFPVANSGSISAPTVQLSNFTAGAHANYTIAFNTSASGGMSGTAHSQITITLPATSSTLSVTNAVVMDAGVQVGTCGVSSQIVEVCTISAGETVNPGDQVTVALSGVTNPSNVSMSSTLTVQTTSDVAPQTSGPYQGSGPPPPTITAISPSSGPASGGAGVMITGTNLTGATAVDFGANGATNVTVVDSSHITATSPPGSGTVDVTVTTPGGTSTTSAADQYTYNAPAQPSSPPPASPPSSPPAVSGGSPMTETSSGAGVTGTVNPESLATTAFFEYGLDPSDRGPGASTTLYDQSTPVQQVGADSASHTVSASLTGLVPGALYHARLVATNSDGTTFGTDQTFTTPQAPAPAPPVLGQTEDTAPVSGTVFIKLPSGAFVLLTGAEQIPSGAEIDALHGSLKITTATAKKGKTQEGVFGGAVFTFTQTRGGASKGLATLSLVEAAFSGAPSYAICKPHKASTPRPPRARRCNFFTPVPTANSAPRVATALPPCSAPSGRSLTAATGHSSTTSRTPSPSPTSSITRRSSSTPGRAIWPKRSPERTGPPRLTRKREPDRSVHMTEGLGMEPGADRHPRLRRSLVATVLAAFVLLASAASAEASTIAVNTTSDAAPTAGECSGNPGDCSLRQAVDAAQPGDTVQLPAGNYSLTLGTDVDVTKSLTIEGDTTSDTTINGSQNSGTNEYGETARILQVDYPASVTIQNLTFTGGVDERDARCLNGCDSVLDADGGGALFNNDADVTLDDVAFTGNVSSAPIGGAVSTAYGTLTMNNVSFTNNSSGVAGALFVRGGAVTGDGITFQDDRTTCCEGGAAYLYGGATVTLENTTVVDSAGLDGTPAIANGQAALTLDNDTLSDNPSDIQTDTSATTTAENTIFGTEGRPACEPAGREDGTNNGRTGTAITSDRGNNIDQGSSCALTAASDFSNVDPGLVPIADNGGPTLTEALIAGSPALGDPASSNCPAQDQRGVDRPDGSCDIGAFEATLVGPPTATTGDATNVSRNKRGSGRDDQPRRRGRRLPLHLRHEPERAHFVVPRSRSRSRLVGHTRDGDPFEPVPRHDLLLRGRGRQCDGVHRRRGRAVHDRSRPADHLERHRRLDHRHHRHNQLLDRPRGLRHGLPRRVRTRRELRLLLAAHRPRIAPRTPEPVCDPDRADAE